MRVVATEKNYTQGGLNNTGNSLDVAINGRGFFQVLMPDGSFAYTRDGSFKMSPEGELVTSSGYRVQPAISIPAGAQSVTHRHGWCGQRADRRPDRADADRHAAAHRLRQSRRPAAARREPAGRNPPPAVRHRPARPGLNGLGTLQQGFLEGSNVNVVEELVTMIETQRAYEMNSKAISTTDQMLQYVSNNL